MVIRGLASPVGVGSGGRELDCWGESSENFGVFGLCKGCARNSGTCLGGAPGAEAPCCLPGWLIGLTTIEAGSCLGRGGGRRDGGAASPVPELGLTWGIPLSGGGGGPEATTGGSPSESEESVSVRGRHQWHLATVAGWKWYLHTTSYLPPLMRCCLYHSPPEQSLGVALAGSAAPVELQQSVDGIEGTITYNLVPFTYNAEMH